MAWQKGVSFISLAFFDTEIIIGIPHTDTDIFQEPPFKASTQAVADILIVLFPSIHIADSHEAQFAGYFGFKIFKNVIGNTKIETHRILHGER